MIARRFLLALFVGYVAWAVPAAAEKTPPGEAAKFMEGLSGEAQAILGAQGSSLDKREADFRTLMSRSFDFQKIGRFVLGRAWRTATPEQRDEYLGLFQEFILRTYTRRLGGYSGQIFKITKAEPMGKIDAVVVTEIGRPSGPPLKAGWRVRGKAAPIRSWT
jgi:phospholipid transport system substrate-binding protein